MCWERCVGERRVGNDVCTTFTKKSPTQVEYRASVEVISRSCSLHFKKLCLLPLCSNQQRNLTLTPKLWPTLKSIGRLAFLPFLCSRSNPIQKCQLSPPYKGRGRRRGGGKRDGSVREGKGVIKCKCGLRPLLQIKCQDVKYCRFHFAAGRMTNPYSSLNKTLIAAQG